MSAVEAAPWGELVCIVGRIANDDNSSAGPVECREEEFVIGRGKDCSLRVTSSRLVSSRHCRLRLLPESGNVLLEDLSTNGTLHNGTRLTKGQSVPLENGDRISLVQKNDNPGQNLVLEFRQVPQIDEESTLDMAIEEDDTENYSYSVSAKKRRASDKDADEPSAKRNPASEHATVAASESAGGSSSNSDAMMQTLLCGICQDILHDCVSLQPCMHAFCAGCYCPWMARSKACPQCRKRVIAVSKNHIVNNLVECFLAQHPDRQRSADDIAELDGRNAMTEETVQVRKKRRRHPAGTGAIDEDDESFVYSDDDDEDSDVDEEYDDDDDDEEDDDVNYHNQPAMPCNAVRQGGFGWPAPLPNVYFPAGIAPGLFPPAPQQYCRQCPGYVGPYKLAAHTVTVASEQNKPVPDRNNQPTPDATADANGELPAVDALPPPDAASSPKPPSSPSSAAQSSHAGDVSVAGSSALPTPAGSAAAPALRNPVAPPPPFLCPTFPVHLLCACCQEPMPDRRTAATLQPQRSIRAQQCELCHQFYCHLYWGCHGRGCRGCLGRFCDMDFGNNQLVSLVNQNTFESTVLRDYLTSQGQGIDDLLAACMDRMRAGDYSTPDSVTGRLRQETIVCYRCGLRNLRDLAYLYRRDIPADKLPAAVRGRSDCYWGRNCRTQYTKAHHASHFNHICEQTRF